VLPKFQVFFKSFDAELPLPTRILLGGAAFFQTWWYVIGGVFVFGGVALFAGLKTERGKLRRDRILLSTPVLGDIVRFATIERFFRILGAMLRAGVPVPDAMVAAKAWRFRWPKPACSPAPRRRCSASVRTPGRSNGNSRSRPTSTRPS
jgi:type IV pilus assembly protein PilC